MNFSSSFADVEYSILNCFIATSVPLHIPRYTTHELPLLIASKNLTSSLGIKGISESLKAASKVKILFSLSIKEEK